MSGRCWRKVAVGYNISKFTVKKLNGLTLPIQALYSHEKRDRQPYAPHLEDPEKGIWYIKWSDTIWIRGTTEESVILTVTSINMCGEWSGIIYQEVLYPALKESKGTLEAILIWESGDSINRIIVKDGEVKSEPVEL